MPCGEHLHLEAWALFSRSFLCLDGSPKMTYSHMLVVKTMGVWRKGCHLAF